MSDIATTYFCDIDDMYACIINYTGSMKDISYVAKQTEFANSFLSEQLGIEFTCAISQTTENINNLSQLYKQSVEIMSYRFFIKAKHTIVYDDIMNNPNIYESSIYTSRQLFNILPLGDYPKAAQLIDTIFHTNLNNKTINMNMLRVLISDVISTLLRTTITIEGASSSLDTVGLSSLSSKLNDISSIDEILNELHIYIKKLCDLSTNNKTRTGDLRSDAIKEFIRENYQNGDLSVSMIADVFGITLNYLSTYFKDQNGEGLAEYIVRYRKKQSKTMIK